MTVWITKEATGFGPFQHGGIIVIGRQDILPALFIGVFDHFKQAFWLWLAIDYPVGVKDFVPAMLAVDLGEHHQLHVGGITLETV